VPAQPSRPTVRLKRPARYGLKGGVCGGETQTIEAEVRRVNRERIKMNHMRKAYREVQKRTSLPMDEREKPSFGDARFRSPVAAKP